MCDCSDSWNEFPDVTIGGPPGDYQLPPPIPSNEHVEYKLISAASSGVNPGVIQISGRTTPRPIDTSGASIYNGEGSGSTAAGFIPAQVIPIGPNQFIPVLGEWTQISSPNGHLFARIDGVVFGCLTIKQRVKILKVIPGTFTTVHPDQPEIMNLAREEKILQAVYGDEGRLIEYGQHPGQLRTVRQLATGTPPENGANTRGGAPSRRGSE